MIDMTLDEKNKEYFITQIEHDDIEIKVTIADGNSTTEPYSGHNLGVYRNKMVENAKENIGPYMDDLGKDSFFTFVKRYAAIIGGVVGLYFLYNVDIHLIMKIIITILVLLGELGYYLYNELYLSIIGREVIECLATEYYIKNIDKFKYFDKEHYTDGFIVPPEDIGKYQLTQDVLEQVAQDIEQFREQGFAPEEMTLSYKRPSENGKSMV